MVYLEDQIAAQDGLQLNVYRWMPEQPAHAALVISHGWSEHAARYHELATWFTQQGFEVHALDHRGHGKSEGKRGHVDAWTDYTRDLETLRQTISHEYQYILGHSMGGMIAALHLLEYPNRFNAAALSGPAADVSYKVPVLKKLIGKIMSAWYPSLALKNKVDPNIVCGNPDVVRAYMNDPLNHGLVSARWFSDYLQQIERLKKEAASIRVPVAIWHGEKDELVAPWVGKQLHEGLQCSGKQFHTVENALHEILFEQNWQSLAGDMKVWLEQY
ncbi:hypothetical protein A3762_14325 [Oleiphilus sp. HI0125]|nr:hypothetical protein A3738_01875 [Oleiphilus sp. HI0066]KZZ61386.1 hypothetical protein A3762_14325 [Oleiphilus sp. HI0125]